MNPFEAQVIGYGVLVLCTLGGFGGLILKISSPITKLQIAVERLTPILDNITVELNSLSTRVAEHGKEIDELRERIIRLEEKLNGITRHNLNDEELR